MTKPLSRSTHGFLFFLLLQLLPSASQGQEAPPAETSAPPDSFTEATAALLKEEVEESRSPGAALLTVESGEIGTESYLGRYHQDLVLPFDDASAWISTTVILALVDEGLLDLGDPLVKFFPGLPDEKAAITLRQLLSHTSGLPVAHSCLGSPALPLETCAQEILDESLSGRPGREFLFGATGLQVAGRIVEIVTEGTWEAAFRQRVAIPLGLSKTTFGPSPNPSIAAGARGTVREYGRFLGGLLPPRAGSRPLLSPVLTVEMLTDQAAGTRRTYWPVEDSWGFGLGVWLLDPRGDQILAVAPGRLGFFPWLARDRDFAAVVVVSETPEDSGRLRKELDPLIVEDRRGP